MRNKIYKIFIIIICFAFVLLVAIKGAESISEDKQFQNEEITDEVITSEEYPKETEDTSEDLEKIELVQNPELRILIKTNDFMGDIHKEVRVTSNKDYKIFNQEGALLNEYNAWVEMNLDNLNMKKGDYLIFESEGKISIPSLSRAQGTPAYYGKLQIYKEESGYTIINVVSMEEYLLTVVPSEMLSTYPLEALKAQAICARSYAYYCVLNNSGLPYEANMNDSTDYQVYNNIQETEITNQAVKETEGMLLTKSGMPVQTYFFSTSCGFTTNETIWKEYFNGEEFDEGEEPFIVHQAGNKEEENDVMFASVAVAERQAVEAISTDSGIGILYSAPALAENKNFNAYIQSDASDFLEAEEQWYRWTYTGTITPLQIQERLMERYAVRPDLILTLDEEKYYYVNQPIGDIGNVTNIEVVKRLSGGVADELLIETTKDTYLVIGEYNIRYVLSDGVSEVIRNDGSSVTVSYLLPSAYFIIEPEMTSSEEITQISLIGGGYGHGVGMSQNGAKQAALKGMTCNEILSLFYSDLELVEVK